MILITTEVLTGDPWELAKVVRRLGRRCRELGEKRDAAQAQRDQLESEWSSCAFEYKQALARLEEALIAPRPHERCEDVPMTATEVNARQELRRGAEGTGEEWDRSTAHLVTRLADIWHQFEHRGGRLDPFPVSMRELGRLRVRAAFGWDQEAAKLPTFNGVPLRVVSDAELDAQAGTDSLKSSRFHD